MCASVVAAFAMTSCSQKQDKANPLMSKFATPYEIAPFDQITIDDYREAMLKGIEEEKAEIQAIIDSKEEPTFANVIAAMDKAGELSERASGTFGPISSSNSTQETRDLQKELSPIRSAFSDWVNLNPELFAKVKAVYDKHNSYRKQPLP